MCEIGYYEDNRRKTTIEVPDGDCEIWVEEDYQRRLEEADDKSAVRRRTAQEIMDEECNRPTYNSEHRETRRHVSLDALDPLGDTFPDENAEFDPFAGEEYEELRAAIEKLEPAQKELLRKVFWQEIKQADIAREEGVYWTAVNNRLSRIYARLRKLLDSEN